MSTKQHECVGPTHTHFWSVPNAFGEQECLWCRKKRAARNLPPDEEPEVCPHDELDHGICLSCGEDRDPNSDNFGKIVYHGQTQGCPPATKEPGGCAPIAEDSSYPSVRTTNLPPEQATEPAGDSAECWSTFDIGHGCSRLRGIPRHHIVLHTVFAEPIAEAHNAALSVEVAKVEELTRELERERARKGWPARLDAQLERISNLPIGKGIDEDLADAVERAVKERDTLRQQLERFAKDAAENHTALQNLARPFGIDVDGSSYGVPGIVDIAEELAKKLEEAQREAVELSTSIWRQFFRESAPEWKPLDYPAGVISQIDNMFAGLRSQLEEARAELARTNCASCSEERYCPFDSDIGKVCHVCIQDEKAALHEQVSALTADLETARRETTAAEQRAEEMRTRAKEAEQRADQYAALAEKLKAKLSEWIKPCFCGESGTCLMCETRALLDQARIERGEG